MQSVTMQLKSGDTPGPGATDKFSFNPTRWLSENYTIAAITVGAIIVIGIIVIVVGTKRKKSTAFQLAPDDTSYSTPLYNDS